MATISENIVIIADNVDERFDNIENTTSTVPAIVTRLTKAEDDIVDIRNSVPTKVETSNAIATALAPYDSRIGGVETVNIQQGKDILTNATKMVTLETRVAELDAIKTLSIAVDDAPAGEVASGNYNPDSNMLTLRVPAATGSGNVDLSKIENNISDLDNRVTTLEDTSGSTNITVNSNGGLEDTANGLGIKTSIAASTGSSTSGLVVDANGTGVLLASTSTAVSPYLVSGRVATRASSWYTASRVDNDTYSVPSSEAHIVLNNKVIALETSIGDISTALTAIIGEAI